MSDNDLKISDYESMQRNTQALQAYEWLMSPQMAPQVEQVLKNSYYITCIESGLHAFGYGKMPAGVLVDKRMRNPYLLALLGLVCAQAGENNRAILSRSAACQALCIGGDTFTKYMGLLCEYGYVIRSQPQKKGFQTTEYRVNYNAFPVQSDAWINLKRTSEAGVVRKVCFPTSQYGNIPKLIIYNEQLSVYEKTVYVVLLLMGGYRMQIKARRDFIGELCGIRDVDIISRCMRHLDELGLILREKSYGRNATGTEYTVLLKPRDLPQVPASWIKHDCLKIIQTKAYREMLNKNDFLIAVCDYTDKMAKSMPAANAAVSDILASQEALKKQFEETVRAGVEEMQALRKEENAVKRETASANCRRIQEMAARGMTAEEIFGELCEQEINIPHLEQYAGMLVSKTGYEVRYGITDDDIITTNILRNFSTLPDEYKHYVRTKISAGVPSDLRDNPDRRDKAARYVAELLDGLRCESKLEAVLASQIRKTLLDGINHPGRLGFDGRKVKSGEFCDWVSYTEMTETVCKLAESAIRRTKRKFQSCSEDISALLAYVRKVFLNSLYHVPKEDRCCIYAA